MKTLKMSFILSALLLITLPACEMSWMGEIEVIMTDAPAIYEEVNVDIKAVMVQYAETPRKAKNVDSEGWMALSTKAGIYNLLELQNNVATTLAPKQSIPKGKLIAIRLVLGDRNTVKSGGTLFSLIVPSSAESGLKIAVGSEITSDKTAIVLDFDAQQSIHVNGEGLFILNPVITVIEQ